MTDLQIIKIAISRLKSTGFGNQKEIGRMLGYTNESSFSQVLNGKVPLPPELINKVMSINEDIKNFILKSKEESYPVVNEKANGKLIGELNYPIERGETPFIELGEGQYLMVMPLVNEYAYAGYLSGYADPEYVEELSKHTIIVTKQHKGNYRAFEIVGDSMDDGTKESIPDGSIATGREIQRHLWSSPFHTHRFKDYIIVHQTEGILNKRITKHDVSKGFITCHSLNPDKNTYPDFDLHLDEIKQIFNIVNVSIPR